MKKGLILLITVLSFFISMSAYAITWQGTISDEQIACSSGNHTYSRFRIVDSNGNQVARILIYDTNSSDMKALIEKMRYAATEGKTIQLINNTNTSTSIRTGYGVYLYVWE